MNIKNQIIILSLFILSCRVYSFTVWGVHGIITANEVNLYKNLDSNRGEPCRKLKKGDRIFITWGRHQGAIGIYVDDNKHHFYTYTDSITLDKEISFARTKLKITSANTKIFDSPYLEDSIPGQVLEIGKECLLIGENGDFYKILRSKDSPPKFLYIRKDNASISGKIEDTEYLEYLMFSAEKWSWYTNYRASKTICEKIIKEFPKYEKITKAIKLLGKNYLILGEIYKALEVYSNYYENYSELEKEEKEKIIENFTVFVEKITNLRKKVSESQEVEEKAKYQFQIAEEFYHFQTEIFQIRVEVGYEHRASIKQYQIMLEKYPNSEFADNAEFKLIWLTKAHFRDDDVVELYGVEKNVNLMKSFIKKYPKSELIPEAKIRIAYEYFEYVRYNDMEFSKIKMYINLAIKNCKDIINNHPNSKQFNEASDLLKKANQYLDERNWNLQLKLNDTTFFIGDTVTLTFKLINLRDNDKEIRLYSNLPNFEIYFSSKNKMKFVEGLNDTEALTREYKKHKKILAANGGYYTETLKLQELIALRTYSKNKYGRYIPTKEGKYKIIAIYGNRIDNPLAVSNEISFTVKEKN